jgi:nitroreductase
MTITQESITKLIRKRYSCRSYQTQPITPDDRQQLTSCLESLQTGPLGAPVRFQLAAATGQDRSSLRGLGTYGFIKGATGFIIGVVQQGEHNLEDFGCALEQIVLAATGLGLGTCWLGGSFTRSSFARKINHQPGENIPAVIATGYPDVAARQHDRLRRMAGSDQRLPWERLFFRGAFSVPLTAEQLGAYAVPLEMVRLAPSASNKQPWRIVQVGSDFHFYLQRTPRYGAGSLTYNLLRLADLQRVDIGIAMCHFEQAARAENLQGHWEQRDPGLELPDERTSYVVSWIG